MVAQVVSIICKYTFTGNFSAKSGNWFVSYMVLCVGYLIYNSFYVFVWFTYFDIIIYPSGSSWMLILVHLIIGYIIPAIVTAAAIDYMLKTDIIHITDKDLKTQQNPILSAFEILGSIVPISIGNYYTVKMYLQSVIYGQTVYGHTVANKESLSNKNSMQVR